MSARERIITMGVILKAKDLCKTFSNESVQQHVLKNLNIEIDEGEFAVIMGSSGSGKSTLLYTLSGMERPTLGNIAIRGEEISGYSNDRLAVFRRKNCGFVFQQNYLNDTMTALDNIMVSGLLLSREKKKIAEKTAGLFEKVGLSRDTLHKYPAQLSGGEAQRVAFVRGIINTPSVLFADEPTGALNSKSASQVLDIFTELNTQGQTILMVTHDMKAAIRGSRILYLQDGVILDELRLGAYSPDDDKRPEQLRGFLREMGW